MQELINWLELHKITNYEIIDNKVVINRKFEINKILSPIPESINLLKCTKFYINDKEKFYIPNTIFEMNCYVFYIRYHKFDILPKLPNFINIKRIIIYNNIINNLTNKFIGENYIGNEHILLQFSDLKITKTKLFDLYKNSDEYGTDYFIFNNIKKDNTFNVTLTDTVNLYNRFTKNKFIFYDFIKKIKDINITKINYNKLIILTKI